MGEHINGLGHSVLQTHFIVSYKLLYIACKYLPLRSLNAIDTIEINQFSCTRKQVLLFFCFCFCCFYLSSDLVYDNRFASYI